MKRFQFRHIALWIAMGALSAVGQPQAASDPSSLALKLRSLAASLSDQTDSRALTSLPTAWEVEIPQLRYSISTGPLRRILAFPGPARTEEAKLWLDQLAGQLEGFGAEFTPSAGD